MKANYWYTIAAMLSVVLVVAASVLLYQSQQVEDTDVSMLSIFCKVHMLPVFEPGAVENCDVWAEAFIEMYPATREKCIILADLPDLMWICLDNRMNGRSD